MSILSSLKKALGFPDEYDEENDAYNTVEETSPSSVVQSVEATDTSENRADALSSEGTSMTLTSAENIQSIITDCELPGEVLDAVIEQFNKTQPEFVRQCIDIKAQRAYLLERMTESLRNKLNLEAENARRIGLQQCEKERSRMARDIENFKSDREKMARQKEELKNAQLSATRQKRALNDRIRDLEQQVTQLEADKEQFQLENRGLINKLRVADVKSNMNPDSDVDIDRLARENIQLKDRIASLEGQLKEAVKAAEEAAENSPELQQEMIDEIEQKLHEFEDIKRKKDKRINQLNKELTDSRSAVGQLTDKVKKLEADLQGLSETNSVKDKEIEELRAETKRLTDMINASENSISQRRKNKHHKKTVATADNQPNFNSELTADEPLTTTTAEEPPTDSSDRPKVSAIDELMDSTDWFTAPDPVPLKKDPEVEELFGYKEPQRKLTHDDDKQLSLF